MVVPSTEECLAARGAALRQVGASLPPWIWEFTNHGQITR